MSKVAFILLRELTHSPYFFEVLAVEEADKFHDEHEPKAPEKKPGVPEVRAPRV